MKFFEVTLGFRRHSSEPGRAVLENSPKKKLQAKRFDFVDFSLV